MCDCNFCTVFGDRIIGKMGVSVRNFVEIEIGGWESNVWLRVDPNCERVPIGDQYPLSNVKLATFHY